MNEATQSSNVIPIDGIETPKDRKSISRNHLINRLNYINFQDGSITANFRHISSPQTLSINVKPKPCTDENLTCAWESTESTRSVLGSYVFSNLIIDTKHEHICLVPELLGCNDTELVFLLPENAVAVLKEKTPALSCNGIQAQLIQNSAHFSGALSRFNATSFELELTAQPPKTFHWIQSEKPVQVIFSNEDETLYAGECRITGHRVQGDRGFFTIEPSAERLQRFESREFRSWRHRLNPAPHLSFRHPFTGMLVQCPVVDVSGTGFCVAEPSFDLALPAGLILPSVELHFAGMSRIVCKAQVVYRSPRREAEDARSAKVLCGMAILDITIEDHTKLLTLLYHAENNNCYTCNQVDLDALWDFFFETGFIYPQKYVFLRDNRDRIKRTYERLYNRPSTIARHITYQEGTRILAHIGMLRFYQNAWLIQHHAGNTSVSARAGLEVLKQVGHFSYDCHRLHAIHMDYLICYFRPENKFPARIFGRIAKNIKDPAGCSMDCFAYHHYRKTPAEQHPLPPAWTIEETTEEDLGFLSFFYGAESGGLMLDALDLVPEKLNMSTLSREYRRLGLRRERYAFSLKHDGRIQAVIVANRSNVGLNLSDLTSAINVIIIEPERITGVIIDRTLQHVSEIYDFDEIPVLLYPSKTAEKLQIPMEKQYNLWVLKMSYSDHYFRNLNRMLRFVK